MYDFAAEQPHCAQIEENVILSEAVHGTAKSKDLRIWSLFAVQSVPRFLESLPLPRNDRKRKQKAAFVNYSKCGL